ncbi:MAG TPA: hypothetical protein PKC18_04640 [Lacipirellulaceae bacterium]|nr:hypothetical protein [Lacipirellulaceae bacterium]
MSYADRRKLYTKLEKLRERPVIVYVTSARIGASGEMAGDVIPELLDQLTEIPGETKRVDLLLVSTGGDATVAWRAMSLLRERFEHVSVLLPQAAYSAATLLALGADEIIMHPHANLGPVDPQITVQKQGQAAEVHRLRFGYQDLAGFLEFAKKEVGITDQKHLTALFQQVCNEVGTIPTGVAARSSLLSASMGRQLLRLHMKDSADDQKVEAIVDALNTKYFHHGYPVSRTEARQIDLKIADPNEEVEKAIWKIWLEIEADLEMRQPFNPAGLIAADPNTADVIRPAPLVNVPANTPAQIANQIFAQMATQVTLTHPPALDYETINAVLESPRRASRYVSSGKILASRMPDGQVRINLVQTGGGWKNLVEGAGAA